MEKDKKITFLRLKSGEIYLDKCIFRIVRMLSKKYSEKFNWFLLVRIEALYFKWDSDMDFRLGNIDFFVNLVFMFKRDTDCYYLTLELFSIETLTESISRTIEKMQPKEDI